jgi:hypothetical protein
LDGVWLAVMMGSHWKSTVSRKKIDAHRYNNRLGKHPPYIQRSS